MVTNQRIMESGISEATDETLPGAAGMCTLLSIKTPLRDANDSCDGATANPA
jgi:hypothetical protein